MAKILLGCLMGKLAKDGIVAVKAILDFTYLAQYRSHSDETLAYLNDALQSSTNTKIFLFAWAFERISTFPNSMLFFTTLNLSSFLVPLITITLKLLNAFILTSLKRGGKPLIDEMNSLK